MQIVYDGVSALYTMPLEGAALWTLIENVVIFAVTVLGGEILIRVFRHKAVTEPAPPLTWMEIALATSCVLINAFITFLGVILWRAGIIQVRMAFDLGTLLDVLVFFFVMDFAMYVLHRVAHHPLLYPLIHLTHHKYENPRPLTLFVLNPIETLSFGILWLILVAVYPATLPGMLIYLTLNLAFGLMGHLGVEPMPGRWLKIPLLNTISTSTFHAEHHQDKAHNYGFYTLIWDRLFGTLSPEYDDEFTNAASKTTSH